MQLNASPTVPRERGVYEQELTLAGQVEFTVVFSDGEVKARCFLARELWGAETLQAVHAWLDLMDPVPSRQPSPPRHLTLAVS